MRLDPRTAAITLAIVWMAVSALSAIVWWTRRRYAGFGYVAIGGPATVLGLLFLSLRHAAPDWLSVTVANAVLVLASVLYLEGARAFRSLPARQWSVYVGGFVTIATVAFFAYVVPSLNARAAAMSAYLAVLCLLTAITLLRAIPPGQVLGLRLTGTVFALCGATHVVRAAYFAFGPRFDDLLALSGVAGAFFVVLVAEMSLFPVGLMLAAHERMMADLKEATELAVKADALSTLSGKLMAAQEQERDWIARELHDDLAQRATALSLQLDYIARNLPHGTSKRLGLQHTCDLAADLATSIPRISHQLHSSTLEHLGLAPAAGALCRSLSDRHGIEIDLRHDELPNLSKDVALCLFRVLQEALNNAVKHAGVQLVTVTLRGTSSEILLSVEDHGVGFDPEATGRTQGLGIISMTERLNLVAGRIRIESRPGAGTTVHARVPLRLERNVNPRQALM
jgi:signal transduction histidine kinase